MLWENQFPSLLKLWITSWQCAPIGNNWEPLSIEMNESSLRKARRILTKLEMFSYRKNKGQDYWLVGNWS